MAKDRILIVDDEQDICELIQIIFETGNFETRSVGSGKQALSSVLEFAPSLVLLDYMLPDVNGNIVCQTIKRNPDFEKIRIIIVSGVVNQDEIEGLLHAGASDFVKKPFDIAQLVDRIVNVAAAEPVVA